MKFLVDMPLSPSLAIWLRSLNHDCVHALEEGLHRATDQEILDRALGQDRIIVTADLDYPRLLALLGKAFPGLILFRGGDFSKEETVALLGKTLDAIPPDGFVNTIVVIERSRIRRRRLSFQQ